MHGHEPTSSSSFYDRCQLSHRMCQCHNDWLTPSQYGIHQSRSMYHKRDSSHLYSHRVSSLFRQLQHDNKSISVNQLTSIANKHWYTHCHSISIALHCIVTTINQCHSGDSSQRARRWRNVSRTSLQLLLLNHTKSSDDVWTKSAQYVFVEHTGVVT